MQNLEKRVSDLEQANYTNTDTVVFVIGVQPGHLGAEIDNLRSDDGTTWTREAGESEQAFKARASKDARHNAQGVTLLYSW